MPLGYTPDAADFALAGLRAEALELTGVREERLALVGLRAQDFSLTHVGTRPSLLTSLIAYWKLEDTAEALGTYTLTNNGATFAAGKLGNAATLAAASSQYLTRAHASALSPTGDLTLSAWVKFSTLGANRPVVFKALDLVTASSTEYGIYYSSGANRIRFWFRSGAAAANINADNLGAPSTGVWYHVLCRISGTTASVVVNGGTANTGTANSPRSTTTQDLYFGRVLVAGTPAYLDGQIDAVGLWGRAVTDDEAALLYGSGSGLAYPF